MVFPVVMYGWELDCEEGWALKNWCFWTVVLEKTLESPLVCKEIQPVHSKGDQPWDFFGRNDAKAETPVLWPPHVKSWLIGKDSDAGRDWGQEGKGTTEDEMAGWHHWLDEREFEWTPGVGDGHGGLACCDSWGRKQSDTMSDWTNWTDIVGTQLTILKKWKMNASFFKWSLHPSNPFWSSCLTIIILLWLSVGHILLSVFTGSLMLIRERQHVDSMSQTVLVNLLLFFMRTHLSKENMIPSFSPSMPATTLSNHVCL